MSETEQTKAIPVVHDWSFPGLLRRAEAEFGMKVGKVAATEVCEPKPAAEK